MRRLLSWAIPLLCLAPSIALIAQGPKSPPEARKLEAWVGTWHYEGEAKASAMGPAAKFAGTQTGRMNGVGLELQGDEEKGQFGAVKWGELDVYDAAAKNYPFLGHQNDGTTWSGAAVVSGNTWKTSSTLTVKGTAYRLRGEGTFSADGKSFASKGELSVDGGKTWTPVSQTTMTRLK
jgi:hypothetical protein